MYNTLYDTVVYGEGLSAVAAALTLQQNGQKVLAVSPSGYLGGEITVSLLPSLSKGVCAAADALIENLEQAGAWANGYTDSVACQVRILKLLKDTDILFYERPAGIIADGTVMQGIVLAGKNGLASVYAKTFIDASDSLELVRLTAHQNLCNVPECDHVYNLKFQILENAGEIPQWDPSQVRVSDSVWDPEKIIEIRNGSLHAIRPVISQIKSLAPQLKDCIMTAAAFHPCRLQAACLKEALPLVNLFAGSRQETYTFEEHHLLTAQRMADGEVLAQKAMEKIPAMPLPAISAEKPCIPSGSAGETAYDVLVCGGGTAGALAAIASGRSGVKTCIWEAMDYLGGVGTGGALNGYYYGLPGGLQDEVDQRVQECEKLLYGRHAGHQTRFMRFHPFAKMIVLEEMALEANVTIEYGKIIYGVETEVDNPENLPAAAAVQQIPSKKLTAVESASEKGLFRCRASVFIDSTGDGDVAVFAGASYTAGREPDAIQHIFSIPAIYLAACEDKDENGQVTCRYRSLFPINMDAGYCDACDPWDVSRARIIGIMGFDAPRFNEDGHVLFFSAVLGARASRQILGDYKLGLGDQIKASEFPDLIAYSASHYDNHARDYENESLNAMLWTWALDAHNEPIGCEIPYRTMLPLGIDNLLVACRSLSLEFDANLQFRMQRDMQRIGEAAGIAAAAAVKDRVTPRNINIRKVQDELFKTNALKSPETHYHCLDWKPDNFYPDRRVFELDDNGYHLAQNLLPAAQDAYQTMQQELSSPDAGIRYCAALKMAAGTRSPEALSLLLQCIRERCKEVPPNSWRFRIVESWKIAIAVCGSAEYHDAREELEKILEDPECRQDPQVLILTVRALAKIGNARSAEVIRRMIQDQNIPCTQIFFKWGDNDPDFRDDSRWKLDLAAYETLYRLGDEMPELAEKYREDKRGFVRQALAAVESRLAEI